MPLGCIIGIILLSLAFLILISVIILNVIEKYSIQKNEFISISDARLEVEREKAKMNFQDSKAIKNENTPFIR